MREILFKGQRTDNKEWIYGHYFTEVGRGIDNSKNVIIHFIKDNFGTQIIIPETVCQYTGLTDKNGVKIFEGDVVKWSFGQHYWEAVISSIENNKSNTLYAIETFHNCTKNKDEDYIYERSDSRRGVRNDIEFLSRNIVVIGNIHDKETLEILINK